MSEIDKRSAWALLTKYNSDPFHLQHARTVALVMRYFALTEGFESEADFWETVGMLHDLDFEQYPDEHCVKAREIMTGLGLDEKLVHAVISHGYGMCIDVAPESKMEKILFACDELTGLIGAAALMRPSKSTKDMELKSLKKKFKDHHFAAGCSRETIQQGADMLGWELDELLEKTLKAMQASEDDIANAHYYE